MKTFALFGDPVSHSLSPQFQNAALKAAGVDAQYVAIRVSGEELPAALDRVRRREFAGANVTIPHKLRALALCDEVTKEARQIGAVNWLGVDDDGALVGDNTDALGFGLALAEAGIAPRSVAILGAGGAARAAVVALLRAGATRIVVGARRAEEATALADALWSPVLVGGPMDSARLAAETSDLVVSAVPPAAWGEVAPPTVAPGARICDMAYASAGTPAERWAAARGLSSLGGLPMLLHQGALSFERWLKLPFPIAAAHEALGWTATRSRP